MDRTSRQRRLNRLQIGVAVVAIAGLGVFTDLAAQNSFAATPRTTNPDQQVTTLENSGGGAFFSANGSAPLPSASGNSAPQTSSGGS